MDGTTTYKVDGLPTRVMALALLFYRDVDMKYILLACFFVVTGCASITSQHQTKYSDTMQIIKAAAESAPQGVEGLYTLKIVASGSQRQFVYLNTEADYRDQRSVSVALNPSLIPQLTAKYGVSPQEYFVDKTVLVTGPATRIQIFFYTDGRRTSKYYYQTHIRISDISQIEVVDGHP